MESKHSQANRPKSMCQKIGEEEDEVITSQENLSIDLHRRRHAINITNNPGYRVSKFCTLIPVMKICFAPFSRETHIFSTLLMRFED
jgi:hypothetical protein